MKLIAIKRGFYGNSMIHPGQEFEFAGRDVPKWAAKPEAAPELLAEEKRRATAVADTKPKAAQAAVKVKAAGMSITD